MVRLSDIYISIASAKWHVLFLKQTKSLIMNKEITEQERLSQLQNQCNNGKQDGGQTISEILSTFNDNDKLLLMQLILQERINNNKSITNDPIYLTAKASGFSSIPDEATSAIVRFDNMSDSIYTLQQVIDILFTSSNQSYDVLQLTYEEIHSIIIDLNMKFNDTPSAIAYK